MEQKKGLSKEEVELRIQKGQVNISCDVASKTYGEIIRENVFTFFNGLNLCLAICVACVHSYRNMLFLGVVFWNTLIGIVQEIRAKKVLDHMALLLESKVFVWRDKERKQVLSHEVVLDDCVELHMGEQVCADVRIFEGSCEVDESMLTGESDAVKKKPGDQIFFWKHCAKRTSLGKGNCSRCAQLCQPVSVGGKEEQKSKIRNSGFLR